MGSSKQTQSSSSDYTQQTTFAPRTQEEQDILSSLSGLGTAQKDALMQRIQSLTGGASPFALSPQDQAQLDQAYGSAQQQLEVGNKDFADFLSGGRGMRMSDTPIAQQAMQRQALGLAELLSQKANMGLNMGLTGNQYMNSSALGLGSAVPAGLAGVFNPLFQERLAGGKTRTMGQTNTTGTYSPSLMSNIQQGIGIASSLGAMGAGFMGGIPGLGAAGAGGASARGGFMPLSSTFYGPGN